MSDPTKPPTKNEKSYILEAHKRVLAQQGSETESQNVSNLDTEEILQTEKGSSYKTGLRFASFNYINSIVGSGVIGIPYALHQAGFGMGFLLLLFVALVTDYSLTLMVRSAHISGSFSYPGLMEAAFGKPGFYLLTILQFLYPFIAMVSYNVVVGDTITKVLIRMFSLSSTNLLARRDVVVLLATICVTIPLCLYKDMARLARASLMSLFFVIFILATITLRIFTLNDIPDTENAYQFFNWDLIPAIGIMAFADIITWGQGVFTAVPLAFVLPAVSYLKLEEGSLISKQKLPALGLAFFGLIVAFLGAAQIVANIDLVDNCSHGSIMGYCIKHVPASKNLTRSH